MHRMAGSILIYVLCAALAMCALFVWHFYFARKSRRRALEVVGWIDSLVSGQGYVETVTWHSSSSLQVPLYLGSNTFRNASLSVNLIPHESPLNWIWAKSKSFQETVIFEADLDWVPPFSLELQSSRMFARTRKDLSPEGPGWEFERTTPFILTTRKDWQKEITALISNVISCPDRQFLSVTFRPESPHFSAVLALDSISPASVCRTEIFDSLREIAAGASAPQI